MVYDCNSAHTRCAQYMTESNSNADCNLLVCLAVWTSDTPQEEWLAYTELAPSKESPCCRLCPTTCWCRWARCLWMQYILQGYTTSMSWSCVYWACCAPCAYSRKLLYAVCYCSDTTGVMHTVKFVCTLWCTECYAIVWPCCFCAVLLCTIAAQRLAIEIKPRLYSCRY
jgi:hypothetical protein